MPTTRIGDETVLAKTGKTWHEWFEVLERASAHKLSHQEIVALLSKRHDMNDWWSQMIANAFEQHSSMREQYQRPEGYEISVTKTFPVDVKALFESWSNDEKRRLWLQECPLNVTTSVRNRSLRARWGENESRLSIDFYSKGANKAQVVVQHMKLTSLKDAEDMQLFWKQELSKLEGILKKKNQEVVHK